MSEKTPVLHIQTHEFSGADCLIRIGIEIVRSDESYPETSVSEVPDRDNLTIREAILQMEQGRPVRRSEWKPKKHICLANNGTWLFRQDGRRFMPTTDDILADDWETV